MDISTELPVAGAEDGFPPFEVIPGDPEVGLVFVCDHASNRLPRRYGTLGLARSEFERHIAYDPGAAAVTRSLAGRFGAPAVLSTFSRLLIDPNRGADDPTLIMRLSDGAVVPGNRHVDAEERAYRLAAFHEPYHRAVAEGVARSLAAGVVPALVSIHSFTPSWRGRLRPWQVGILWDADGRLALPLIAALAADPDLTVGDNEPYAGALRNDTMFRHGTRGGLAHALIELRQDLIADGPGVSRWSSRLAAILDELNRLPQIHEIRRFGSRTGPVAPLEKELRRMEREP